MAMKGLMARVERAVETAIEKDGEAPRPMLPAARASRSVGGSTCVDAASELEGTLRCQETLRIDGRVEGEIECAKAVLIGERAHVRARIGADEVQISGVVEGDITARRKITLEKTAVVTGDLTTLGIVIEEGAKLKGRIVIGGETEPLAEREAAKAMKNGQAPRKLAPGPAKSDGPSGTQPTPTSA